MVLDKFNVVPDPVHTVLASWESVPTEAGWLTVILIAVAVAALQTPLDATALNHVVWVKTPVLNTINGLLADSAVCSNISPTLAYVIPSAEACHWMFPMLPAANATFTLVP